MEGPALALDDVVVSYGDFQALSRVTFQVNTSEVFGLLGHNGAGKTTLIRLANGLLSPSVGGVRAFGLDPVADGRQVRSRTGVLTEYPALDAYLTAFENVVVYAHIHGLDSAVARTRAIDLIERLQLTEHAGKPAHSLSAGLKQRVALARALVHRPSLLLLDEPTSNLDPMVAMQVRGLIRELAREDGRTVVLSTHNLAEAQSLCDRLSILQHGRLLAVGTLVELGRSLAFGAVRLETTPEAVPDAYQVVCRFSTSPPEFDHDHLTFSADSSRVPAIVEALVSAKVPIRAVIPQAPTLEDVYVSLHGSESAT